MFEPGWSKKDYYRILGVEESASAEDIAEAFLRLDEVDRSGADHTADHTAGQTSKVDLAEAYAVLSNPSVRQSYDLLRRLSALGEPPRPTKPPFRSGSRPVQRPASSGSRHTQLPDAQKLAAWALQKWNAARHSDEAKIFLAFLVPAVVLEGREHLAKALAEMENQGMDRPAATVPSDQSMTPLAPAVLASYAGAARPTPTSGLGASGAAATLSVSAAPAGLHVRALPPGTLAGAGRNGVPQSAWRGP